MNIRKQYRKKQDQVVTAVQLDLDTPGFTYQKWGSPQVASAMDWLVNNNGEVYTVQKNSFAATYTEVSPGRYTKSAPVWAVQTDEAGEIKTKEGVTAYPVHSYLVSNDQEGTDTYAVTKEVFEEMYEEVCP